MCVKESNLLAARGNSLTIIHDQFPTERQTSRQVKQVVGIFNPVKLPSFKGNESYNSTGRNKKVMEVRVTY